MEEAGTSVGRASEGWLLRQTEKGKRWTDPDFNEVAMAHHDFGEEAGVSVFWVQSDVEEAVVAAALFLPRDTSFKQPSSFLRVLLSDLPATVEVRPTQGKTGLARVDALHRDLHGTAEDFRQISRSLRSRFARGEAVLRQVAGVGLTDRFLEFRQRDDLSSEGQRALQKYLKKLEVL